MNYLDYNTERLTYSQILDVAITVSELGAMRPSTGIKMTWMCVLHTRICVMGTSLKKIAPLKYNTEKMYIEWDYASMFSLTRNIMECYQTEFYLCSEAISEDERLARKKLFDIHDFNSRKKLFAIFEHKFENDLEEENLVRQLTETIFFRNLSEKQQTRFLKGDDAFFFNREDLEERMGNDKKTFKYLYKLLSSNTHSFPMGFYGMLEGNRGTGVGTDVEVNYSALALQISGSYIFKSIKDMINLFPDISKSLNKKELSIFKEYDS